jgi:hypothetical protein
VARRLVATVVLRDPVTLAPVTLGPGDDVPGWAAALITNPEVWEGEAVVSSSPPVGGEPPRSGRGASAKAWRRYAESVGVVAPEGASREEIIAAVDAA